ncbi:fungal-specific transcription factor domain-containing protein [Aspergillus similis]
MAIAWAAHILRNQCASKDATRYNQIILTHKCQSLKFLHNMVTQDSQAKEVSLGRTKCERDAFLLLIMFHCLLEIASGSIKEWTYHMNGALMVIKFYTNSGGPERREVFSQEVLELVYSFFLEKGTFLGTTTHTRSSSEHRYLSSFEWSTEVRAIFPFLTSYGSTKIDPCMGLSPELLDIISCITMLSQRRHTNSTTMTHEFINLVHRLIKLETRTTHSKTDKEHPHIMTLLASAFQSATWIYLHHVLANCSHESDIIQITYLPTLLSTLAQIHKTQGPLLGFLPYPMWALFIASCVVLEEGRIQILEWFSVLNANKPVSNVPSTMAAVRAIWKRRDFGLECARDEGSEGSAIWMDAIGNLGWLMPFT